MKAERKTAIILAALRHFQTDLDGTRAATSREAVKQRGDAIAMILDGTAPHMDDLDAICEEINSQATTPDNLKCPKCGSDEIEGDDISVEGNEVWQECGCLVCNAEWNDIYEFKRQEIISRG